MQTSVQVVTAQAAFEALLQEPLLAVPSKPGRPTLPMQVRFLALKNLAALLAAVDATAPRALKLYAEALRLDAGDTVLWHRMGVLVRCPGAQLIAPDLPCEMRTGHCAHCVVPYADCAQGQVLTTGPHGCPEAGAAQAAELGQWGLARALFEHGLRGSPRHTPLAERLAEVLLVLGDYQAAAAVVAHLLRLDACHPRARQLAGFLAAHGAELPEAARRCLPGACPGLPAAS